LLKTADIKTGFAVSLDPNWWHEAGQYQVCSTGKLHNQSKDNNLIILKLETGQQFKYLKTM
jgi:hypothetical protein